MRFRSALSMLLIGLVAAVPALAGVEEIRRAESALRVLDEMNAAPDQRIPASLLANAEAVAVIPDVVKAGLVVAGRHGKGMLAVRGEDGSWSNPSFISLSGGSLGLQAGVQSSDLILVFRTRRGVESLNRGKFTLGADAAVAAGPVGRYTQAATDKHFKAEIYAYSRARGLFAGIALNGAVLGIDDRANATVFGDDVTPRMIFDGEVRRVPSRLIDFRDRLEEASAQ
ncbi:MAG: lipid-binding SYLF domain-containing protein [Lysobacteraceae bacterium]